MRFEQVIATIVISLLAGTVGAFLILMGHLPKAASTAKTETAMERVVKSGTLKCGYMLQPPYFMKDPNTNAFSGLWYELTEKIAALSHLKVVWAAETTERDMAADLQAGKFDVFCAGWPVGGARAQELIVTTPLHYSTLGVFARADDARFDAKPDAINRTETTFSVRLDTPEHARLLLDFPAATRVAVPAEAADTRTIDAVLDKKADLLIAERTAIEPYVNTVPSRLKEISSSHALVPVGRAFALRPDQYVLRDFLNVGKQNVLGSSFIESMLEKYTRLPGALRAAEVGYSLPAGK